MKASEFCYWLQGYFEISGATAENPVIIDHEQSAVIQRHLALVFVHDLDPAQVDAKLQEIHDGKPPQSQVQIGGTGPNGEVYRC